MKHTTHHPSNALLPDRSVGELLFCDRRDG